MSSKVIRGDVEKLITPLVARGQLAAAHAVGARAMPFEDVSEKRVQQTANELELKRSYEKGFQEGQAAAARAFESEIGPLRYQLSETLASFAEIRVKILSEAEQDLVKLAIAVAKRILHRELSMDPEALRGLVKVALDRVGGQDVSRVRTHPSNHAFVELVLKQTCPDRKMELTADATLAPGGLVFETERGDVDASIESQLEEIQRGLTDRLGGGA